MTVHHLHPRVPRHASKCLAQLVRQEQAGRLKGIAFVAIMEDGFVADACGIAHDDPERTLQMIAVLESKLAKRAKNR